MCARYNARRNIKKCWGASTARPAGGRWGRMVTEHARHEFVSGASVAGGPATVAASPFFGFHPARPAARLDPIARL